MRWKDNMVVKPREDWPEPVWPVGLNLWTTMMAQAESQRLEQLCEEALRGQRLDRWHHLTVVYHSPTEGIPTTVASLLEPPPPPMPTVQLFGVSR